MEILKIISKLILSLILTSGMLFFIIMAVITAIFGGTIFFFIILSAVLGIISYVLLDKLF